MDIRLLQKITRCLFVFLFGNSFLAQRVLVYQDGAPATGIVLVCGNQSTITNDKARFELECPNETFLILIGEDSILVKNEVKDTLVLSFLKEFSMGNVDVIAQRMHYFDIAYLPPIRGTQIATGTSSLIETERQGGAKSTANPRELFSKIPGINIWESDGAGIQMGVGGRGLSPDRATNFNTRQNGYDISADALGYPESYYTPPLEALSSIEIIRGSASLQYGTQFGGLMNFVIREAPKNSPLELTARLTVGNFGYLGSFLRFGGTHKRWSYQAYNQLKNGAGYRENSDFKQQQNFCQLTYNINEKQKISAEFTSMNYTAQQAGGLTDTQFLQNDKSSFRNRNYFQVKWNILNINYDLEISKKAIFNLRTFGMLSSRSSLGFLGKTTQIDPLSYRDLIQGKFKNGGLEARFLYSFYFKKNVRSAVLFGTRTYFGNTENKQGRASTQVGEVFQFKQENDLENSDFAFPSFNQAFFLESLLQITEKWAINTGIRAEKIQSSAIGTYKSYAIQPLNNDTISVFKNESSTSLGRTIFLVGAGFSFQTSKYTKFYGNWCMNYRAVNFSDIRVANPNIEVDLDMKDEKGSTAEIGWRGTITRYFYLDLAGFYLFYGQKIGLAPKGIKKIRTNIGDAQSIGIEMFSEIDWLRLKNKKAKNGFSTFANFAYIKTRYLRSIEPSFTGNQLENVAPIILRTGLKFRTKSFQVQGQFSYTDKQFSDASNAINPSGDALIGLIPAYSVVDFSARYMTKFNLNIEFGINNVLNKKYFTRRAQAYPGPGILPADGRFFYTSLIYQFSFKNAR